MNKPLRTLVLALTLLFAAGCSAVRPMPLPGPGERAGTPIRGVVIGDPDDGGREIEFKEVYNVDWGENEMSIQGWLDQDGDASGSVTRRYAYGDLSAVLAKQFDANKTSFLIAGAAFVTIATVVFFFTERTGGAGTTVITPGG